MSIQLMNRLLRILALGFTAVLLAPFSAYAQLPADAAGKVLLVIGGASIERGQTAVAAQRGALLESGDTLVTSLGGRMHVRMRDGAMIALKPDTRFTIEQYGPDEAADATSGVSTDSGQTDAVVARDSGSAVMSLLRGGFRTLTGLIGRRDFARYSVKTPVATIGVRGTDYTAYFCGPGQCGGSEGLHLGVWDGGVSMSNDGGEQNYTAGEFGYVPNSNTRPSKTDASPLVAADSPPILVDEEGEEDDGSDDSGEQVAEAPQSDRGDGEDLGPELRPVEPDPVGDDAQANTRSVSFAHADNNQTGVFADNVAFSTLVQDANGNLTQFDNVDSDEQSFGEIYSIGTATNANRGTDPITGIEWGRWTTGVANVEFTGDGESGSTDIDLSESSLHYVFGPVLSQEPAFELSGTASYALVGNTDPTDNLGNVGVLGSADLFVNFTNQSVDHSLELDINQQIWSAFGTGSITSGNALFSGNYSSVEVDGTQVTGGSGDFRGFFSQPDDSGLPAGAGLTYNLSDGSTDVTGSAAFRQQPDTGQ